MRKSMMETATASSAVVTMPSSNTEHEDCYARSLFVQSMYAGSSASFSMDRERERKYRPKPLPPVKPARLRNISSKNAQGSFPPSIPPKPLFPRDPTAGQVPGFSGSTADFPKTSEAIESRQKKTAAIFENMATDGTLLATEPVQAATSAAEEIPISAEAARCAEEVKGEPHTLKPAQISSDSRPSGINIRRASFINEEIKKPKIKPPPPPTQFSSSSSSPIQNTRASCKRESTPNLHIDLASDKGATVDAIADVDSLSSSKPRRFERKSIDGEEIPRYASMNR